MKIIQVDMIQMNRVKIEHVIWDIAICVEEIQAEDVVYGQDVIKIVRWNMKNVVVTV